MNNTQKRCSKYNILDSIFQACLDKFLSKYEMATKLNFEI